MDKIPAINQAIKEYFELNKSIDEARPKDLMKLFIKKGGFEKDHKEGLPIRKVLRDLDKQNQLNRIPTLYADRKTKNTNWYFLRSGLTNTEDNHSPQSTDRPLASTRPPQTSQMTTSRDEDYVIDLCDKALNHTGSRQHKFDFLRGDPGRNSQGVKLPVDVYYEPLSLVIEYRERQHTEEVKHFDKPDVMTVSGVHRGEQRKIYDQRRRDVLPKHGIKLIEISYSDFEYGSNKKIIRNHITDLSIVQQILKDHEISTD